MDWLTLFFTLSFVLGIILALTLFLLSLRGAVSQSIFEWLDRLIPGEPQRLLAGLVIGLVWFGGLGLLFKLLQVNSLVALVLALAGGGAGFFVMQAMARRHDGEMGVYTPVAAVGKVARVVEVRPSPTEATIVLFSHGEHHSYPAQNKNGQSLSVGQQVVVTEITQGKAVVEEVNLALLRHGGAKWANPEE